MFTDEKVRDAVIAYRNRRNNKISVKTLLSIFRVSRSTFYKWIKECSHLSDDELNKLFRTFKTSSRQPTKLTKECELFLINYVTKNPNCNIKKLIKKIKKDYDISINKNYIYHILKKNNITYKKIQKNSFPYGKTKFKKSTKILKKAIDECNNNFTAIDETAIYLGTSKNYGWSLKGKRSIVKSNFNRSTKYSLCQAISREGIVAQKLIKNSFNTIKYNDFVINDVIPNMPNNTILMDGCSIHKSKHLEEILKEKNIKKIMNVPYSPQFNPIEYTFNTFKNTIKKNNINTFNDLSSLLIKYNSNSKVNGYSAYYDHTYNNIISALK